MSIDPNIPSSTNDINTLPDDDDDNSASGTDSGSTAKTASTTANPPPSALNTDTIETTEASTSTPPKSTNVDAQAPQLSEVAYQKIVGDASRKFDELLAKIAELDSYDSDKFSSAFADMAVSALESYLDDKAKIVPPPVTGEPGEKPSSDGTVTPGGSSTDPAVKSSTSTKDSTKASDSKSDVPPGTAPPVVNPYASIEKAFDDRMDQISQSRMAMDHYSDYLSQNGVSSLNLKSLQFSQSPEDVKQLNYALDQKSQSNKTDGDNSVSSQNQQQESSLKNLFNSDTVKILTPILGKEVAEKVTDLARVLTVELLSVNGLKAGKDAIGLLSKGQTSNSPITSQKADVAASVGLIQNLSKLITPDGKASLKSIIDAIFSKDPTLKQIPGDVQAPVSDKLSDDVQTSILKVIFLIAESGLKLGDGLTKLLAASSPDKESPTTTPDPTNSHLSFPQNSDTIKAYIPSEMPDSVKQNPSDFLQKIYNTGDTSPKDFANALAKNFIAAGVSPSDAYTKASQITLASLPSNSQTESLKSLPDTTKDSLSTSLAEDLQKNDTPTPTTTPTPTPAATPTSTSGSSLQAGTNLSAFGSGMEAALIAEGESPEQAEDTTDELVTFLEEPPPPIPLDQSASDSINPDDTDGTGKAHKSKISTIHKDVSDNLTSVLQSNIPSSEVPKVSSQLMETLTGYPNTDAISSPQSANPHSLINVATDKISTTKNYFDTQEKDTSHATVQTANFKDFIKEHSDLSTFAEELRSPATALVMTWGLMNEGTFKFSGQTNSIDFLG